MARSSRPNRRAQKPQPDLFESKRKRVRRSLILPQALHDEAEKGHYRGKDQDHAHQVLRRWAEMEAKGQLDKKETALDASFLHEVFGDALGYSSATQNPERYTLERNFAVPGVGTADGALGIFEPDGANSPSAVIELKGASCDLDVDRSNGRTAVQQCWDYLNALPDCPWGIVSNFVTIRLYHRNRTPLAYEEFSLQDLRDIHVFRQFYCLFARDGLLPSNLGQPPRALALLEKSDANRLEVGDRLYAAYSDHRVRLIRYLIDTRETDRHEAIRIAQKILDRIIFIAFCEWRGLLPGKSLESAHEDIPPFTKVTNPRWRNFLDLFAAIDKGHERLDLQHGYNGGLFRHDPEVDDLQLPDEWTDFFHDVSAYDFNDEVNVDVLGHIFERSISDLRRLQTGGLFDPDLPPGTPPPRGLMPKSAERKRSGIYYTPPDFTRLLVERSAGFLVRERQQRILSSLGLRADDLLTDHPSKALADYWKTCWDDLRSIKLCDPACGSGAFLIAAYDLFEEEYVRIADHRRSQEGPAADNLIDSVPDLILNENLYGVDLSEQSVEITQLALWIRSARKGKTLADLSRNIIRGNSLAETDLPFAFDWPETFPAIFGRDRKGFDCIVGNPPWERLKLQEREFFADSAPEIAGASNAAKRRKLITALEHGNPDLYQEYEAAKQAADQALALARNSGRYPLTGQGDINTYMLFAELASLIVAPDGRVGLLVPSGIATDNTTRQFFASLVDSNRLIGLYDFENKAPVFPDVHRSFKFCAFLFGGKDTGHDAADFVFFARRIEDLRDKKRHIPLTAKDFALLNPNTRTCPVFRSRRDADLTKAIYRRVPVLIDESRQEGGNPWGIRYVRMFDQTNDAELFHSPEDLARLGLRLDGNRFVGDGRTFLPLYEAKMVQAYDHRAASVVMAEDNWVRQGQTEPTSLVQHQNPEFVPQPRWWVEDSDVEKALKSPAPHGFLGFKDITSPTNERTMIAAAIPLSAVTNHFPLLISTAPVRLQCCLLANLNSFVLDYVARQKIGGITLNFFIVNQLPLFPPDLYAGRCPWDRSQTLEDWISERVLKLSCTANDMLPFANAAGFSPPVHKWMPEERAELSAELDAAFFHLYGLSESDVLSVLGNFRGLLTDKTPSPHARRILESYHRLERFTIAVRTR